MEFKALMIFIIIIADIPSDTEGEQRVSGYEEA